MKKSLRILTALSIAATSLLNATTASAVSYAFDTANALTSAQISTCSSPLGAIWADKNAWKFTANIDTSIAKVQVFIGQYYNIGSKNVEIFADNSNSIAGLLGTLVEVSSPSLGSAGISTYTTSSPIQIISGRNYWIRINSYALCGRFGIGSETYSGSAITVLYSGSMVRNWSNISLDAGTALFAIFTSSTSAPGAPTSVTATSTGATTADVAFTAPASNGGATITSYTATSSPGGITGTISQAGSGTIHMTGLTAGTAYTFTVRATNSAGAGTASSASNSITTVGAPSYPTSVVATATGKRSATVSFGAPSSNNGSAVTSYTATSTPGGLTQTLTQATGGTFNFDGLQPGTAYTFSVTATNAIGISSAATSNSVTTTPLVVASLSALSFVDDGTGTGGKIVWAGKNIDAVLYTGPANSYPGPFNFGAFTGGWNGRIRNLTAGTEYTVSIFAISADGVGESKSLTFKTSATLPALPVAKSSTISRSDELAAQLPKLFTWIDENVFVEGEAVILKMMLNKFDAITAPAHSAYLKLPRSRVATIAASTSTPKVCAVESGLTVHSIAAGTCTISYTVSGASKAPATMVKDFVFAKFAK